MRHDEVVATWAGGARIFHMKYGMPRKIDDVRRNRLILGILALVLLVVLGWSGCAALKRPAQARRDRLALIAREGRANLESLQTKLVIAGVGKDLAGIRERLVSIAASVGGRVQEVPKSNQRTMTGQPKESPSEREEAEELAKYGEALKAAQAAAKKAGTLAETIASLLDGGAGGKKTRAEARIQDMADALDAVESLRDKPRPSSSAVEGAERRFNEAYGKALEAANQIPTWKRVRAEAKVIEKEMTGAKQRMNAAATRVRAIRASRTQPVLDKLKAVDEELGRAISAYLEAKGKADENVRATYAKCHRAEAAIRTAVQVARNKDSQWPWDAKELVKSAHAAWQGLHRDLQNHQTGWNKRSAQGAELLRQAEAIQAEVRKMLGTHNPDATRASELQKEWGEIQDKLDRAVTAFGGEAFQLRLEDFERRAESILENVRKAKEAVSKRSFGSLDWKGLHAIEQVKTTRALRVGNPTMALVRATKRNEA